MPSNAGGILIGSWGTPESSSYTPFNGSSFGPSDIANNFPHSFTQAQVDAGQVFYRQFSGNYGDQYPLVLSVSDNASNTVSDVVVPVIVQSGSGLLSKGVFIPNGQIPAPILKDSMGETSTIGSGLLTWISPQFSDSQITYTIWYIPQHGSLLLNGASLSVNATFTQTDINLGRLAYREDGSVVTSDAFGLKVADPNNPSNPSVIPVTVAMEGKGGGQVISGTPAADTIIAGTGGSYFFGDGNTVVSYVNSPNPVQVDLAHGTAQNGYGGTDTFVDVHSVTGSAFSDVLTGTSVDDTFWGGNGNDSIYGGAGNNLLEGGTGDDLMIGGSGNDLMYAGDGFNYLYGEGGNDVLIGGKDYTVLEGGDGNDYAYLYNAGGTVYGGNGNDVLVGNLNNDILIGDAGDDVLYGYGGNDYGYGGDGNDVFYGGDGVDVLIGGAGNDYFDGGTGVNYYFGGGGAGPGTGQGNDTFVLSRTVGTQSIDVVQDWTEGLDHVNLIGSGFTSFADLLSHSYQNGAYFIVQPDANNAIWLNGATASTVTASDFSIVS
ncbi:cadherin-like domain-containing protein (plasmid) [Bradyrhizobium sp. 2S1]|nr:cadherin-like domain-containing protein [Bradyrhizobium sp. 2S1]MCK7664555.1 hypothetical protein [Bradyrhizobium sp. 2S1]